MKKHNRREGSINEIMLILKRLWYKNPQLRFGQLLENYVFVDGSRGDNTSVRMFYQGDDVSWRNIENELNKLMDRELKECKKQKG